MKQLAIAVGMTLLTLTANQCLAQTQPAPEVTKASAAAHNVQKVNINTATLDQLDAIPGLGKKKAQAVIVATGSEVQLALKAQRLLADKKIGVRVVSMPSTTTFDREDAKYKSSVLPAGVPRVAVEMGVTDGWWKYGCAAVVGIDTYGESAPAPVLFKHFGFTAENVADTVHAALLKA